MYIPYTWMTKERRYIHWQTAQECPLFGVSFATFTFLHEAFSFWISWIINGAERFSNLCYVFTARDHACERFWRWMTTKLMPWPNPMSVGAGFSTKILSPLWETFRSSWEKFRNCLKSSVDKRKRGKTSIALWFLVRTFGIRNAELWHGSRRSEAGRRKWRIWMDNLWNKNATVSASVARTDGSGLS